MEQLLNTVTLPASIGIGAHIAGRLVEKWRRTGDITAMHLSEFDPEEISAYENTPYPIWAKGLFHALPTLAGLGVVHFAFGNGNLTSPENLIYGGVNLGLFLLDNLVSKRNT